MDTTGAGDAFIEPWRKVIVRCRHFSNVKIGDIRCRTKVLRRRGTAGLPFREEVPEELIVPFVASTADSPYMAKRQKA